MTHISYTLLAVGSSCRNSPSLKSHSLRPLAPAGSLFSIVIAAASCLYLVLHLLNFAKSNVAPAPNPFGKRSVVGLYLLLHH